MFLLFNLVDVQALISKLLFRTSKKMVIKKEEGFLEIVGLWYQLKNKCDEFNLNVASQKLDEVFPLLNGVLDNEQTIKS
jgi:hypothetical protein